MNYSILKKIWDIKSWIIVWITPLLLLPLPIFVYGKESRCAYVVLIMVIYWLTDAIPLAVTSLIPMFLYPLMGILSTEEITKSYMNQTLMVFLGSVMATVAIEHSNLHKRIALRILMLFGTSPKWLLLGFMTNTSFISMWISNTATAALMVPIVDAVLTQLKQQNHLFSYKQNGIHSIEMNSNESNKHEIRTSDVKENSISEDESFKKLSRCIYLGVGYGAAIGGTGTITGTSTNLVFKAMASDLGGLSFANWMFFSVPTFILCILSAWLFMFIFYIRNNGSENTNQDKSVMKVIRKNYEKLGPMTFHESGALSLFSLLLILCSNYINDASAAMLIVVLCFMIPSNPKCLKTSQALVNWKIVQEKVPWNILLLFGGGYAMAKGAQQSGLSGLIGTVFKQQLQEYPSVILTIVMCLMAHAITEVTSNGAAATILLPIVKQLANDLRLNPLQLMIPVTLSCSHALMIPSGAPSNAIVFEAGKLSISEMAIPGLFVKILCLTVVMIMINSWGYVIFNFSDTVYESLNVSNFTSML